MASARGSVSERVFVPQPLADAEAFSEPVILDGCQAVAPDCRAIRSAGATAARRFVAGSVRERDSQSQTHRGRAPWDANGRGQVFLLSRIFEILRPALRECRCAGARPENRCYEAARLADSLRRQLIEQSESFIFESVFSDPVGEKLEFLKEVEQKGYSVVLFFIGISGPAVSDQRVAMRVMKGGHDVPAEKVTERFPRVMRNLGVRLRGSRM